MEAMTTVIPLSDLRRLLSSLVQHEVSISIRYRTLGQLWYPNFLRIVKIDGGKSVLFHDETRNKLIALPDLTRIIQFELDSKFHSFEPNCHYQVTEDQFGKHR